MRKSAALAALLLASCQAESVPPAIAVQDSWARSTASGQTSTAAYFTISNPGGEDRLVGVSSPFGQASLHSTTMDGGVMRMRPVESLEIPARSTVVLKPGGLHVMITGLERPLDAGTAIPLDLSFERAGDRRIEVAVRPAAANGATM